MKNILNIASRQFRSYFNGPIAYIVAAVVLFFLGYFFWESFFGAQKVSVRALFFFFTLIAYFAVPPLTMGLMAEEKRTGTIELLITMPVTDAQVILGKWLGVMGFYVVLIGLTIPFAAAVSTYGDLDLGPVVAGYLGLVLHGALLTAIGLMTSSFTSNQIIAFFTALVPGLLFFIFGFFLPTYSGPMASLISALSPSHHFEELGKGVLAIRDLLYFFSATTIALGVAFRALESRRWS